MTEVKRLVPVRQHWQAFCKKYPELALAGTPGSYVWFGRQFNEKMIEGGGIVRAASRKLLADPERFDQCAYNLLTVGRLPEVSK